MSPAGALVLIALSLAGPLALVWLRGRPWFPADRLRLRFSAGMWGLAGALLVALRRLGAADLAAVGLSPPTWRGAGLGLAFGIAGLLLAGAVLALSRGRSSASEPREMVARLAAMPLWARLFALLTVAATEEVLFRLAPVGAASLAGLPVAPVAAVGLAAFVVAHVRWGRGHALFVAVMGAFLTLTFLLTRNGWANMVAHAVIDVPPLLFSGAMMRGMVRRSTPSAGAPT